MYFGYSSVRSRLIAWALILPFVAASARAGEVRFRGREVTDKKTGLSLVPVKEIKAVAASSLTHHYFLILPSAGEWRLESSESVPLTGSDGRFQVTLLATEGSASPSSYLQDLLAKLQATDGLKIRDAQFSEERGYPILSYQAMADGSPVPEVWQWNYWTVAVHGQFGFALHLSTMDQAVAASSEEQRIRTLLTSLRADFKR